MKQLWVAVLFVLLSAGACSNPEHRPSNTEIEKAFTQQIPVVWELKSFDVTASENAGTKVEPVWQFRFKASTKLSEDTFVRSRKIYDALFINKVAAKDVTKDIFGIANVILREEKWKVSFQFEGNPFSGVGNPRNSFADKTVIEGTNEEKQFKEDLIQKLEEKNTPDKEQVARALMILGDDRGKKALTQILMERIENINASLMSTGNANISVFYKTVQELGKLRQPEAIPSILHAYKYQKFGNTPRSYAKTAIRQIGKPGLPYLEKGVTELQEWYFSKESRSYHRRVYGHELTDKQLSNLSWGPKYVRKLIQEIR